MKHFVPLSFLLSLLLPSALFGGDLVGKNKFNAEHAVVAIIGLTGQFVIPGAPAEMDQIGMRFSPQILPILVGTTVSFPNSERTLYHNVYSLSGKNNFNLGTYRAGTVESVTFNDTGVVEVLCNIHVRMYAAIIVLENPYFTVVDDNGKYRIANIPQGTYTVELYYIADYEIKRQRFIAEVPENGDYILDFE